MEILDKNTAAHILEASAGALSYDAYKKQMWILAKLGGCVWFMMFVITVLMAYFDILGYFPLIFVCGAIISLIYKFRNHILDLRADDYYVAKDIFLGTSKEEKWIERGDQEILVKYYFAHFEEEGKIDIPDKDKGVEALDEKSRAMAELFFRHANLQDIFDMPENLPVYVIRAPHSKMLLDVIPVENVK